MRRAAAGVLALVVMCAPREMGAQSTGSTDDSVQLRILAPRSVTPGDTGQAALDFSLAPVEQLPPNAFLRIRGLPEAASLNEGYAVALGAWAVPLRALGGLKATLPPGGAGRATLTVQLVSVDGVVLAETSTVLVLDVPRPPEPVRKAEPKAPPAPPSVAPPPPRQLLPPDERQRAEKLVAQGDRYLESGNIAIARQFFQRAADAGLALGALRLAATFDPNELERMGTQGVVASPADARRWYERARQLGAPEADERLAKLTN